MKKLYYLIIVTIICTSCSVSYKFTPEKSQVEVVKNNGVKTISSQLNCNPAPRLVDGQMMVPLAFLRDLTQSQMDINAQDKTATLKVSTPEIYFENYKFKERLLSLIKGAKKQIFVEIYILTNIDIIKALAAKQNTGVKVCVIIDDKEGGYFKKNTALYKSNKLKVRRDWIVDNESIMHRKLCVIDSKFVTQGSSNWTLQGLNKEGYAYRKTTNINEEVNMVFDSADLARQVEEQFYANWRVSKDIKY